MDWWLQLLLAWENEKIFSKRQSGGGGVTIRVGFGFKGATSLAFIDANLDFDQYQNVLPFPKKDCW